MEKRHHWGDPPPPPPPRAGPGPGPGSGSMPGTGPSPTRSAAAASPEPPPAKRRRESGIEDDRPLAITCTPCRARKISVYDPESAELTPECDSKKPTCDNCSKNPNDCVYPIKLKPGLRPGTGIDMAKRLEQLEERVQMYEAKILDHEAQLLQLNQWQNHASLLPLNTPVSSMPPPALQMGSGDTSTSVGLATFSPVDVPSGGTLDIGSFNTNASPGGGSVTSFLDSQVLPPDDIVRDLISLFFSHIAPWAPIIAPMPVSNFAGPPWNIITYAIVVVTLRLSNDPRIASTKQQYRQAAKSHVLSHAIESTSISSVQALALLALDLIGSEQGPSSWGILALLTRSAVHLGLIQEDDMPHNNGASNGGGSASSRPPAPSLSRTSIIPPPATWNEDESRRRLFWLIFCLDRYACVSTGWDFALPDFEIRRRLPCSDEIWAGGEWFMAPLFKPVLHRETVPDRSVLSPMAYLVEALDLLGRAHTLQSRTVEINDSREVEHRKDVTMTLTSAAKRWFAELPIAEWEVGSMSLVIQAIYHATLLKLNAYYAFPALSNGVPVEPYGSTCLSSARAAVQLVNQAREVGFKAASSPLFIWGTWVAARVLFVNAFLSHKERPDDDFETILTGLKDQAPYWGLANQYVKLLERAKRKWAHATSYDAETNPSLPDAIHVLLDLRRTAYNAVGVGVGSNGEATPFVSPPDVNLSHLPAWAVQPLLGDLHNWFDLPAGLFGEGS